MGPLILYERYVMAHDDVRDSIIRFEKSDRNVDDYMELIATMQLHRQDGMSYSSMKAAIRAAISKLRS